MTEAPKPFLTFLFISCKRSCTGSNTSLIDDLVLLTDLPYLIYRRRVPVIKLDFERRNVDVKNYHSSTWARLHGQENLLPTMRLMLPLRLWTVAMTGLEHDCYRHYVKFIDT